MQFRVGDKVKLKDPRLFSLGTKILEIIRLEEKFIKVIWDGVKEREFPLYPDEIEHVLRKGKQLEFGFME